MANCVVCSVEVRDDARFCPACGAEQPKVMKEGADGDPLIGKVVARKFQVEKILGVGGMGKVYRARQLSLDKVVVVKVLHDHFREDPQLVQRFQREAKAASRLNHPNSIQIIDFGQDDGGVVFMAMEFLQGTDLFNLLKKEGPLPSERIARVMVQVCSALAEAHEQNVIHRDLKPENIMVEDRRGTRDFVKVLDFGIAKIQDPSETPGQALTQAGMVCGTPEYMSPEQARGLSLDPRSDIYALGVLMYQLSTGELPFTADTPIGIVTKHILEKPVPPRERAPHLNILPELEAVMMKAMEKEPGKRFQTVVEMGETCEEIARAYAVASGPGNRAPGSGINIPPSQASGSSARVPAPSGSSTSTGAAKPTATAKTPTGIAELPPQAALPARRGNGLKWAAIAGTSLVVLASAALILVKASSTVDVPMTPPPIAAIEVKRDPPPVPPPPVDRPAQDPTARPQAADAVAVPPPPPTPTPTPTKPPTTIVKDKPTTPKEDGPKPIKVVKGDRAKAKALVAQGSELVGDGKIEDAADKFIDAIQADPSYPDAYVRLANVARLKPQFADQKCKAAKRYVDLLPEKREPMTRQFPDCF